MISIKLNLIIFATIILSTILLLTSTSLDMKYEKELLNRQLKFLETSIKDEYKKRLKESVNHTIMFIEASFLEKLTKQKNENPNLKELTVKNKEELINTIRTYLYSSIFEKSRYSWINEVIDFKGGDNYAVRLIHPNLKKTEGKLLTTKATDIKGNLPFLEELEGVKKDGELYFTYYFKQLDKDEITEKMSYAKLYERFNWIIATGIPINDLNDIIASEKVKIQEEYNKHMQNILFLRSFILFSFITLLLILRRKLSRTLDKNEGLTRELEKKLKTIETNFDKFFELPLNLLIIGNFKGKIYQTNEGWSEILGYKKDELKNSNFLDLVHPNDKKRTKNELNLLSKGNSTKFFEIRLRTKDGKYKTLIWSANSLKNKNLLYAVGQDITELKEKSNILYQQSKMAAIGEMTANIAHQWRQPLSIISTASSGVIVKKMTDDLDDKFLIDTMNQITKSTQYLSDTIESFRNFYSPHKKETEFTVEYIFEKTLNLIEKRFDNNSIEIAKKIEDIKLVSYENELLQVIINILNNARDQLIKTKIDRKLIFINAYKKDNSIYIEIIDNANGIKEDIIDRIFEPYFTTKDKSVGTGIGLYMSEEIVTKHLKGKLLAQNYSYDYENINYKGAKFTIILDAF